MSLLMVITAPDGPAGPASFTAAYATCPPMSEGGLNEIAPTRFGEMFNAALEVRPAYIADKLAVIGASTAEVVTSKVAPKLPGGIVMELGT